MRLRWSVLCFALAALAFAAGSLVPVRSASAHGNGSPTLVNADAACAQCHAAIYERYERTSKAQSSGVAADAFREGSYLNPASGVRYDLHVHNGVPTLGYERIAKGNALQGSETLAYYVGSGKRGRTYLFSRTADNAKLWYEAPVNWYTRRQSYAMAPAFEEAPNAPLALPTNPNCLHCHATGVNPPLKQAANAFANEPFRQGGVGCSSCHGDAAEHLRSHGKTRMLDLVQLPPAQRESICLQCHLEGDAVVYRPGRSLAQFKPGEDLAATAVYFVNASSPRTLGRASSQYEGLLRSACRRAAGEKLTCVSCHDPHATPGAAERVAWFRGKCLACHNAPHFDVASHHAEQPDCASCHMPSRPTTDISHEQTVNHDIEVYGKDGLPRGGAHAASTSPQVQAPLPAQGQRSGGHLAAFTQAVDLVPVGAAKASERDLVLAYAQLAARGSRPAFVKAEALLTKVQTSGQADLAVEEQMAYLAQLRGDTANAQDAYAKVLAADPENASALTNTAVLRARAGDVAGAEAALRAVIARHPAESTALVDLARLEAALGKREQALEYARQALHFNPDGPAPQQLLHELLRAK